MNRNLHSSHHNYGGTTGGSIEVQGRTGGHHHHTMNPTNNMDSYSSRRSSERMSIQQNSMGANGPLTPGGGMGGSGYQGQMTQDSGSPVNASNMQGMGYAGGHMDSSMNHHAGMMGNSNMFDARGTGPQNLGNFSSAMTGADLDSRMMASRRSGGRSGVGVGVGGSSSSGAAPGTQGGSSSRSGLSQADREEELLLNLLIARRQRGRTAGGEPSPALRDELMRIRQQGGMIDQSMCDPLGTSMGGASTGGTVGPGGSGNSLPPMHGIPPIYDSTSGMGSNMMGNGSVSSAFSTGVSHFKAM